MWSEILNTYNPDKILRDGIKIKEFQKYNTQSNFSILSKLFKKIYNYLYKKLNTNNQNQL